MRKILVVVDYQKDFVNGALGFAGAENLDAGIAAKIREYGEGNVFYTMDSHDKNYLETREGKALPVEHCLVDDVGWEIFGEAHKALLEVKAQALTKKTFGVHPILMNDPAILPRQNEVESVELVGLVTNICVISNAVTFQAKYPEAQIVVDASLCASFDRNMHEKALDVMEGFQVKVVNRGKEKAYENN